MSGRQKWLIGVSVAVGIAMNALIWQNEARLSSGARLYLPLKTEETMLQVSDGTVPLRYEIADAIEEYRDRGKAGGTVVVRVDRQGVAEFARASAGGTLGEEERRLEWRYGRRVAIGPSECRVDGDEAADRVERAAYAEIAVGASGAPILVGLRDDQLEPLDVGCGVQS